MKKITATVLISTVLAASMALHAEAPAPSVQRAAASDEVNINFKDLKIADFVKMVARITGKNILVGENIQGTVDFVSVEPVKKDQIYTLLMNVLDTKGFTILDTKNGFLKVVRSSEASKMAPPSYGDSDVGEMQTAVIDVKRINVRTILRQINFLQSKNGKITLSYENNSVVVSDFPENIKAIRDLIYKLDQGDKIEVQFVTLKNADAKVVAPKVQKLTDLMYDRKIDTQKVDVFADEATNAVIIVGSRAHINTLIPKIRVLDKENETVDKRMEIIYVKNADAVEVVKTLEKLLLDKSFAHGEKKFDSASSATSTAKTTPNPAVPVAPDQNPADGNDVQQENPAASQAQQQDAELPSISGKDKPTVTVDAELNAIVVYATEREIKELSAVIERLDVERQQVYVKARIFEFSDEKASEIGAKYGIGGGMITTSGIYGFSGNLGGDLAPVESFVQMATSLTAVNSNLIKNLDSALALGVTMSLFRNSGAAAIVSEPSLLCVNNKESSLYSGRTESILSQANSNSNTLGGISNSYTREDIGLTLKVKPRISADDKVSLEVKTIMEDVVGGSVGLPTTTKSEVETVSIVTNGETVIIGGLAKDKDTKNVSKIPILGDIPILGIPFRHESKGKNRSNLIIMLTPYIVKKSEDLSSIKEILGNIDILEKELAVDFEKKYALGQTKMQRASAPEITQSAAVTTVEAVPEAADYYYRIDEYGNRHKVYLDKEGHELRSEQIVDPKF